MVASRDRAGGVVAPGTVVAKRKLGPFKVQDLSPYVEIEPGDRPVANGFLVRRTGNGWRILVPLSTEESAEEPTEIST